MSLPPLASSVLRSTPKSVSEIFRDRVTLTVESIDRMYLNVYVPSLQRELGLVGYLKNHLGYAVPSTSLVGPIK